MRQVPSFFFGTRWFKLIIFQSPVGCNKQLFGRLGDEAFQNNIRTEMLYIVHHEVNIFIDIEKMEVFGIPFIFQSHTGAAYQLQLMHFQRSKR